MVTCCSLCTLWTLNISYAVLLFAFFVYTKIKLYFFDFKTRDFFFLTTHSNIHWLQDQETGHTLFLGRVFPTFFLFKVLVHPLKGCTLASMEKQVGLVCPYSEPLVSPLLLLLV